MTMNALPLVTRETPVGSKLRHVSGATLILLEVMGDKLRVLVNGTVQEKTVPIGSCWLLQEYQPKPVVPRRTIWDVAVELTTPKVTRWYGGTLDAEAKKEAKKARYLENQARRAEENRNRAKRGGAGSKDNKKTK